MSAAGRDWRDFSSAEMLRLFEEAHGQGLVFADGLVEALELAWRASLHADEGRPARFVLAFGDEDLPAAGAKILEPPVRVGGDPRLLARLSCATDPWRVALHVRRAEDGTLEARALAPLPELPAWTERAGRVVAIEVSAPGQVALVSRFAAVTYEHGRHDVHARDASLSLAVSGEAVEALLAHGADPVAAGHRLRFDRFSEPIDREAWERHAPVVREEARRVALEVLHDDLLHLAVAIRRRGHGGAVLLLPQGATVRDAEVRAVLAGDPHAFQVEERVSTAGWNGDMLAAFTWRLHVRLAEQHGAAVLASDALCFLHGRDQAVPVDAWLQSHGPLRIAQAEGAWRAQVESVADLCQLDGAVVLSALHEPLAMGAFFRLGSDESLAVRHGARVPRGTRHRSMHHAVESLPGASGLVVSHDGDVTLHRHRQPPSLLPLY